MESKYPAIRRFALLWLPLLVWMGIIFYFSSLPGSPAVGHSWRIFFERKTAHVVEYFILAWLVIRWLKHYSGHDPAFVWSWSLLFPFIYAISDEIHQSFVSGREARMRDVFFDLSGILIALALFRYFSRHPRNKSVGK